MMGTIYHARTRGSMIGANDGEVNMDMLDRLDVGMRRC